MERSLAATARTFDCGLCCFRHTTRRHGFLGIELLRACSLSLLGGRSVWDAGRLQLYCHYWLFCDIRSAEWTRLLLWTITCGQCARTSTLSISTGRATLPGRDTGRAEAKHRKFAARE